MTKQLKVYGWTGRRREAHTERNHHGQTREIVAAPSKAAAARAAGVARPSLLWNLCETRNAREMETALSRPGVVFWSPLHPHNAEFVALL